MKNLITGIALCLCALPALAADPIPGQVLTTLRQVEVFRSPPEKKFLIIQGPGSAISSLTSQTQVTVRDTKMVATPARNDVWVRLDQGWAYYGTSDSSSNFR